jgi:ubiquinone/menaquinone biosynthesis C-methylase UbiE
MHDDIEIWEELWQKTDNTLNYKDVFYIMDEIKLEYLLPILPSPKNGIKTIEVGCGSARLSCFLASLGYKTTCLDYSKSALMVAKENYRITNNKGEFILGDAQNIPVKSNSFDVVLSTGLLEHFEEPQLVINEMVRILKPGGVFYSDIVPKKFSLFRAHIDFIKKFSNIINKKNNDFYEKKLNSKDIKKMLSLANLEDINVFPAGVFLPQIPYGNKVPKLKKIEYNILHKIRFLNKYFDDTILAELLGFYYFTFARKP